MITEHAVSELGLQVTTSGWFIQTPHGLTASEIISARLTAAAAGMTVDTKSDEPTSAEVLNWATAFGILLALGILAMTLGLIRSETAGDLRTLAAAGASSSTRRTITAATAGALGLLGAVLGTAAGYLGVIAFSSGNSLDGLSSLGSVPVRNLLVIVVGMPLVAAAVGWLLAGREPPSMTHQPADEMNDIPPTARNPDEQHNLLDAPDKRETESQWAVETHGLTKRFGDERRRQRCRAPRPEGMRVRLPRSQRRRQDHSHPGAAGTDPRRFRHDVAARIPGPAHRDLALARVGAIVDEPRFHGHLTGRRTSSFSPKPANRRPGDRIGPSLERVGMLDRADDRVSKYSMGMRQRLGVAACLLGDPQLLILDEPMNGLDPAGMHEMRDMILSLVAEGRTVVLSSHLLDEVERTCDAVAIVDRGQDHPPGTDLRAAGGSVARAFRSNAPSPIEARDLLARTTIGAHIEVEPLGLGITLPAGTAHDVIAEIARVLVEGGISLYRLQQIQASLESWFLQVTSRLGAPE